MKCPSSLFCKAHNRKKDTIMHWSHAVGSPEQRQMPTFGPSDTFQTSVPQSALKAGSVQLLSEVEPY